MSDRETPEKETRDNKNLLSMCYCIIAVFNGCQEVLPSALFSDISKQLGTSELQTSYIFMIRNVSYIASTFIAALVIDKCYSSHQYYAVVLIFGAAATALIPFCSQYFVQCGLFAVTGMSLATMDTFCPGLVYNNYMFCVSIILEFL